jgi:iron complex transport system substrate-binding protein
LTTAGNGSFVDQLITLAGGINIAWDTKRPYSIFSPEEVIHRNPDCIITAYMDSKNALTLVKQRFGWQGINAVKNNRIYDDIDSDLLLRPGPRIVQGLKEIYKRMYP